MLRFPTTALAAFAMFAFAGCGIMNSKDKLDIMQESYVAPTFSPASTSEYLSAVPNRPGYFVEPQNYEGLIFSQLPPGSLIQSPYSGKQYRLPYPNIQEPR